MAKGVGRKVRQARVREGMPKDFPHGRRVTPMGCLDPRRTKRLVVVERHSRLRKDGIIWTEQMLGPQFLDPADDYIMEIVTQGKEVRIDALREFRVYAVR